MKNYFFLVVIFLFFGCNKDDNRIINNNQFIPNVTFSVTINTNLPTYSQLQFVSNPVLITLPNAGFKGIILMKAGQNDYRAFEASCPNQAPSACTQLSINGINAVCPCDGIEYGLYTGLGAAPFPLKPYRTEVNGTNVRVFN